MAPDAPLMPTMSGNSMRRTPLLAGGYPGRGETTGSGAIVRGSAVVAHPRASRAGRRTLPRVWSSTHPSGPAFGRRGDEWHHELPVLHIGLPVATLATCLVARIISVRRFWRPAPLTISRVRR